MKKKGQALIEFILVLPVLMIIIMSLIDIGNIFIKKYELNHDIELIENMYQRGDMQKLAAYVSKENITLEEETNENLITIKIKKKVEVNAPILTKIIGKKHEIKTSRTFYKEEDNNEQ